MGRSAAMPEKSKDRSEKLAQRLRENLRKRKQQARGRDQEADMPDGDAADKSEQS